jgi:glyoxylase-like metal-dependent hydrolase (beta-lactamase superfamily II)
VLEVAGQRGIRVVSALLTHGHLDHSAGARRFAQLSGAEVRALDPAHRYGGEGLADGEVIEVDGLRVEVLATPGHTADSLCFLLPQSRTLLTGDTVLGRGTAVVADPDGRLGAYLSSLARLRDLAGAEDLELLLPGHGPVLAQPGEVLRGYLSHRQDRLDQIRRALADGASSAPEVVAAVYTDLDPVLLPAAELSVRAQLSYLAELSGRPS